MSEQFTSSPLPDKFPETEGVVLDRGAARRNLNAKQAERTQQALNESAEVQTVESLSQTPSVEAVSPSGDVLGTPAETELQPLDRAYPGLSQELETYFLEHPDQIGMVDPHALFPDNPALADAMLVRQNDDPSRRGQSSGLSAIEAYALQKSQEYKGSNGGPIATENIDSAPTSQSEGFTLDRMEVRRQAEASNEARIVEAMQTTDEGVMLDRAGALDAVDAAATERTQSTIEETEMMEYLEQEMAVARATDKLMQDAKAQIPFTREETQTERGPHVTEQGELEPGISFKIVTDPETGEVVEAIVIQEGAEADMHEETIDVDAEKAVHINGEEPRTEQELETVGKVVEHLQEVLEEQAAQRHEQLAIESDTAEQSTEQQATTNVPETPTTEKKKQMPPRGAAESFMRQMMASKGARETIVDSLKSAGVEPAGFMEKVKAAELSPEQFDGMRKLFQEYPPQSGIWNESEYAESQLGRVAKEAKDKLRKIIGDIK